MPFAYEKFLSEYLPKKLVAPFSRDERARLAALLPEPIAEFVGNEGRCAFGNHFFWTVFPDDLEGLLPRWGVKSKRAAVFMRTAFGALLYAQDGKYYYLDPLLARIVSLDDDAYLMINYSLRLSAILDHGFFHDHFCAKIGDPAAIGPDQVFALSPGLDEGGSFEGSRIVVADLREHLTALASRAGGRARKVRL